MNIKAANKFSAVPSYFCGPICCLILQVCHHYVPPFTPTRNDLVMLLGGVKSLAYHYVITVNLNVNISNVIHALGQQGFTIGSIFWTVKG
jgi:hypothetical protein